MIRNISERFTNVGLYPLIAAGAAVVIIVFVLVAYLGSQRITPNTGNDAGQVGLSSGSASPSAGASAGGSAKASASAHAATAATAPIGLTPAPVAAHIGPGTVIVDQNSPAGRPSWQSSAFNAPSSWTISYTYNCGGYGGHFTVAVFSDTVQEAVVREHKDTGSGTVTVSNASGKGVYFAIDTTAQCAWHVTARA